MEESKGDCGYRLKSIPLIIVIF
ncbi:hypothetical protein BCEP27_30276 [Burkholderia cepacia]